MYLSQGKPQVKLVYKTTKCWWRHGYTQYLRYTFAIQNRHDYIGTGSCTVEAVVRVFTEFEIYYILMRCYKNGLPANINSDWKLSIKLATLWGVQNCLQEGINIHFFGRNDLFLIWIALLYNYSEVHAMIWL